MHEPRRRVPADETVHRYTCPLCECMCGVDVHVDSAQQVSLIRGAKDDVWSKGYICPKGSALGHLHHDPDRIRVPMIRDGDQWREVSYAEAYRRCEELLHPIIERDGPSAITAFVGNPAGHSFSIPRYLSQMLGPSGIPHIYSAGTVDQWPKNVSSVLLYGNMWLIPIPDVTRSDYWLLMGGNPHASRRQPDGPARHARRDREAARAGRQGGRRRSPAHEDGRHRRRVGRDPARHRRGLVAGDRQRAVRGGSDLARAPRRHRRGRRRGARRLRRLHSRVGRAPDPGAGGDHAAHRP